MNPHKTTPPTLKVKRYRLALRPDGVLRVSDSHAPDSATVARIASAELRLEPFEVFIAIYLNSALEVIGIVRLGTSSAISSCMVEPKAVIKGALLANASAMVIAHNHPSGDSTPSIADLAITRKIQELGEVFGIPLQDHVIVTRNGKNHSMYDKGELS